jgi:aquaporin Z
MRPIHIRVKTAEAGLELAKASFRKNRIHYLREALGLAIFMISACAFGALLEARHSWLHLALHSDRIRLVLMGIAMGATALFIFYSPLTAPSGSHINPAVTLTFMRLGKLSPWDALFYIAFQFVGGVLAVYAMAALIGGPLTEKPVHYLTTIPGSQGRWAALAAEFLAGFIVMTAVLYSSESPGWSRYTRVFSAGLVCVFVITAGPLSGFSMNPARTVASALPSGEWTDWWIYMVVPVLSMLCAAELFVYLKKRRT